MFDIVPSERGFAVAPRQGIFDGLIFAAGGLGRVQLSAGRFDEAVRHYEDAIKRLHYTPARRRSLRVYGR